MADSRRKAFSRLACVAIVITFGARSLAEESKTSRAAAAEAFDEAVKHFEEADYEAAARAFLRADDLAPSTDALHNAIAAARKANDHLLVATAAERAIKRPKERQELVTEAREALALAARNLAQVDLNCAPAPCKLLVDGSPVPAGTRYVLPGAYSAVAVAEDGNRTEERLTLAAGVTYSVLVHASKAGESKEAAAVSTHAIDEPVHDAPKETAAASAVPGPQGPMHADSTERSKKPFSPTIFYVGAGVTAVLVGLNVWSGVDAISAKNDLPPSPRTSDLDDVRSKELRSDVIFGSAVVVGAATIAAGILWVDWGGGGATAFVAPAPGGATAGARGRF